MPLISRLKYSLMGNIWRSFSEDVEINSLTSYTLSSYLTLTDGDRLDDILRGLERRGDQAFFSRI